MTLILLGLALLGLTIKLLFRKDAKPPVGSCKTLNDDIICRCGEEDQCENKK